MAHAKQSKDLNDLFLETVKDIYFAEKHILRALPKMARKTHSDELRQAFETHRDQTEGHIDRLDQIFEILGKTPRGKTCEAIVGMLDEGKEIMEEFGESRALDAGLLAAAQAVEHYEISRYGTLKIWAQQLGLTKAVALLEATLAEEKQTDDLLSKLAVEKVNLEAA